MVITKLESAVGNKQLKLELLDCGLLFVRFDSPQKTNHLTSSVMSEFEEVLTQIEQDQSIKAVGLISAKADNFLLGADLREIMQLKSEQAALELVRRGQEIFSRFARLTKPTIAGIHGTCLGGGLELALCCHKRLATADEKTVLGLPETRLGFVPGLGGTQRLPRLLGVKNALDLILSAEPIDVNKALEIGLVDCVVSESKLKAEMEATGRQLLAERELVSRELISADQRYCDQYQLTPADETIFKTARRSMRIITRGNYPAVLQVIDVIEKGLKSGLDCGLQEEAKTFAQLAISETSRNLVFLFFNTELAKQSALTATEKEKVTTIESVGIIGGGMMGLGLAQFFAEHGLKVLFRPHDPSRAKETFAQLEAKLQKATARKQTGEINETSKTSGTNDINKASKINETSETNDTSKVSKTNETSGTNDTSKTDENRGTNATGKTHEIDKNNHSEGINIKLILDDRDFYQADIILEAIEEKLAAKVSLFKQLVPLIKQDCFFSTITSSLSVADIASELSVDIAVMGSHFFHPVDKMPLVEIALPTSDYIAERGLEEKYRQASAKILQFIARLGKMPLIVKDSPCFLVNRLLASYLLEAARLAETNVPLNWIDKAAVDFGMPMGPLTLLDEIGFDLCLSIAKTLSAASAGRIVLPAVLDKVATLGMRGKRSGSGVYQWDTNGKRLGINPKLIDEIGLKESGDNLSESESAKIAATLILPMVDEATRCLEEKIVRRTREVDIASVLALGFPAFRGGILKYADSLGTASIIQQLNDIYASSKPKRHIGNMLIDLAQTNSKFY